MIFVRKFARWPFLSVFLVIPCALAQTTQGTVSGRVFNAQTGTGLPDAEISCVQTGVGTCPSGQSDRSGFFTLTLLSPGTYEFRATAPGFQAQEIHEQTLPVASRLELRFGLRPAADVFGTRTQRLLTLPNGRILDFFAADFDTKGFSTVAVVLPEAVAEQAVLSYTVDPSAVDSLPLNGRDVYAALALEPGIVSDTSTGRGLGLAANGQRPGSSNFLLDGVESNNYLIAGPAYPISPEAVQEYSISTNNFSAEYGRTSGYVANVVTRSGGDAWHGVGYYDLRNEVLNANDFQNNLSGAPREPVRESRIGAQTGGRVRRAGLFLSATLEILRSGSRRTPVLYTLPTAAFDAPPGGLAAGLLSRFLPQRPAVATQSIASPDHLNQNLGLLRLDRPYNQARDRFMARLAWAATDRPDFVWSPYKDFITPLKENAGGVLLSSTNSLGHGLSGEFRASGNWNQVSLDRRWPNIPTLVAADGTSLPGYPALYGLDNSDRNEELSANLVYSRGTHLATVGGGFLHRSIKAFLDPGGEPVVYFNGLGAFANDQPSSILLALNRAGAGAFTTPSFDGAWTNRQLFLYGQDIWRISRTLTLDYGVRYENYGAPHSSDAGHDLIVKLGQGSTLPERLTHAGIASLAAGQPVYDSDNNNFAPRVGFAWRVARTGAVIRGAFGIFYDRPFDNLWQNTRNNRFVLAQFSRALPQLNYLASAPVLAAALSKSAFTSAGPDLTLYQPGLRDGYAENYFLGVTQPAGHSWVFEWNLVGADGRKLITTDLLNREFSLPLAPGAPSDPANPLRYLQPGLPYIAYRANQGSSNYRAFTSVARYRSGTLQAQIAYTFSRTDDNQSDPLRGEFFDLNNVLAVQTANHLSASFSRQFDSGGDRGNSDFDQRHNLVAWTTWTLPCETRHQIFRGWQIAALGAIRSGLPYTVRTPTVFAPDGETILNNRALVTGTTEALVSQDYQGGRILLDRAAFTDPAPGTLGSTPRNAFHGPAFGSLDLSLSRTFPLRRSGDSGQITIRADAYNVLNHANLNNPDSFLADTGFGVATFGRQGVNNGAYTASPLNERARQIQILLKIRF